MVCIYCSGSLSVINSRAQKRLNQIWRRRQCEQCGAIFTTHEAIEHSKALMVTQTDDKSMEPFSRDKLFISILKSCQHRSPALADATALTDTVMAQVQADSGLLQARHIAHCVHDTLQRFDAAAAIHYKAYHPAALKA